MAAMNTVNATDLKNRLGEFLDRAAFAPLAIERHGKVVAYLVPPRSVPRKAEGHRSRARWTRREEERVRRLCLQRDFRPSQWARAGDPRLLAGVATLLASAPGFDRPQMLALAESLHPGMSSAATFGEWLKETPVDASRFLQPFAESC